MHAVLIKAPQIESETHIAALAAHKKQARQHRGQNRLTHAVECGRDFLNAAAERGYPLRATTNQLINLLNDYGASLLNEAMEMHSSEMFLILMRCGKAYSDYSMTASITSSKPPCVPQ